MQIIHFLSLDNIAIFYDTYMDLAVGVNGFLVATIVARYLALYQMLCYDN